MVGNLQVGQERQRDQKEKMFINRYPGLFKRCEGGIEESIPY